ncbi:metal-dependent transcriptional regulator [Nocardiopsis lambiniae]|uniref:Iron dependent repressor, metal binding and dimerization domain protein n=1 Tax=Nocardiopsis lambiniae TaxID=3075539 RepID=A0ABU2M8F7_9ACTN|nr:iron dependent repressor, metal binding and dimerization domain protein [Nocardiopsis sp. DSM 44743]MDT0328950.1 iron dependent repressor, metal binding and dimerization domain protein [Nocardiopsis sp. DSM 44743]
MTAHGLIDTTEMYLRTVFELEEEGIVPLRARIAERLHQSGPTVSQTVARMERDGLLRVENDRHLVMTAEGRRLATHVMRKHRLAERLLVDVIGLPWEDVHIEACRWEHVISEAVEERLVTLLNAPSVCPHGNPIPGLDELGLDDYSPEPFTDDSIVPMIDVASGADITVTVRRISEQIQSDADVMRTLREAGVRPGLEVALRGTDDGVRVIGGDAPDTELSSAIAGHIFVAKP